MTTEAIFLDKISNTDLDYGGYPSNSAHLLSKWLNTLEQQSSLFWLHCLGCNFVEDHDEADDDEKEPLQIERSDTEVSETSDVALEDECDTQGSSSENNADEEDVSVGMKPCKSIAHRDSELLLALTENCSLGPVCYFCR